MADYLSGATRSDPICLDSSPIPVPASPVKIASPKALPKCRKLLFELETSDSGESDSESQLLPRIKKERGAVPSSDSEDSSDDWLYRTNKTKNVLVISDEESSTDSDEPSFKKPRTDTEVLFTGSGAPVFEIPIETCAYTGEEILRMLFNPNINEERICCECPRQVTVSSTFVVNLDKLKHPDDIKKDEYGKWCYTGSHVVSYLAWKSGNDIVFEKVSSCEQPNDNVFQLRRIRSNHPSNSQFQRLLAFVTDPSGNPHHLCLVSYRIPAKFTPTPVPHGNSKSQTPLSNLA